MSKYSERFALHQAMRQSKVVATTGSGGILTPVVSSSNVETIAEKAINTLERSDIKDGTINSVMPLTDRVLVTVRGEVVNGLDNDYSAGALYNSYGRPEEDIPLLSVLLPLINVDPEAAGFNAESLLHKPVKVYMTGNIATQVELVAVVPGAMIHNSRIAAHEIEMATMLDLPVEEYLRFIGHTEDSINDYLKLKAGDFKDGIIFRFKGEGYWDKDIAGVKGNDVYIEDKDSPLGIYGRNYQKMKTQLCHTPIIMFSGR